MKQVLAKALKRAHDPKALPEISPDEVRCRSLDYLDGLPGSPRTEKLRAVFTTYMKGAGWVSRLRRAL